MIYVICLLSWLCNILAFSYIFVLLNRLEDKGINYLWENCDEVSDDEKNN